MSESARKKQRLSPRVEDGDDTNPSTVHADLQRLASIAQKPVTPFRRAASVGATPGSRTNRTPATGRTPRGGPATRPIPARRAAPTTPHAIRAQRERANANRTPGHVRRRSGRVQRETPRDNLRALSRLLAPATRPAPPSPQLLPRRNRHSALDLPDIEDGPDPAAPRLSMPLGDMYDDDEDSLQEAPPQQSLLLDLPDDADNATMHSLEFGRRAFSEDPRNMFTGRGSDLNELLVDGEEYEIDGTFINRRQTMNPDDIIEEDDEQDFGNTTTEIRALTGRGDGRLSDVDLGVFGEDDETEEPTFRFTIPPRMQASARQEPDNEVDESHDAAARRILHNKEGQENDEDLDEHEGAQPSDPIDQYDTTALVLDFDGASHIQPEEWEPIPDGDGDTHLQAYREEVSATDRSLMTTAESPARLAPQKATARKRKTPLFTESGQPYPSFPATTVKALAAGFAKSQGSKGKIGKDTVDALIQASDHFFEQMSEDLKAYADHSGRRSIDESDVIALMKRTRQITGNSTVFSLAQKLLPRELLQQLRMEPPPKLRRQKRQRMETIPEDENDDE